MNVAQTGWRLIADHDGQEAHLYPCGPEILSRNAAFADQRVKNGDGVRVSSDDD